MYNGNLQASVRSARVGGFDYVRIHLELAPLNIRFAKVSAKPNINTYKAVTGGYMRPLAII